MNILESLIEQHRLFSQINFKLNTKISHFQNLIWLGSGLAKIAASYANDISKENNVISEFNSLLYYKNNSHNVPILVSLGGKGDDAINTAKNMNSSLDKGLITCNKESSIYKELDNLVSFTNPIYPEIDRRFVNINGIIALSHLSEVFVKNHIKKNIEDKKFNLDKIDRNIELLFNKVIKTENWNNNIIVLGTGYNSSIEHTWKSILQESAIAQVNWQDIKDFTHGDHFFTALNKNKIFILLENIHTKEYCDIFEERFSQICEVHRISLSYSITDAFWENLLYVASIAERLSIHLGFKGLRPPKNELVYSWRGWGNL